ncbi:hypothetical protein DB345_01740 [Spartobacteria bacterium LR76]|nr:hypothetical protein DB345_01740 [Spartobacteria bacterium LR76]
MKRLILEISLKPFRVPSHEATEAVIRRVLDQWSAIIRESESISFLLWTADGSEILDYRGELDTEIEWAKWIGIANTAPPRKDDPERLSLHSRGHLYTENPPALTYRRLRSIVSAMKKLGRTICGKPVTVGATFDPGPEFSRSDFKYIRHPEINKGNTMGSRQWVHCAAVLNGDSVSYAGFPAGIPDQTTLGTFLGRQSEHFLRDLGFDYIWFSNGFGYSLDSWSVTGEVFNGSEFHLENINSVNSSILEFWKHFRKECPHYPIETRGSNLSTGMDLASDGAPIRDIYRGGFGLTAPVNSPWAALNRDYGLEIVGWLSHIAELPENGTIPFRYYIHDPWWLNSPWLDRYGREPHDIYIPLSCGRIGTDGCVQGIDSIAFLTVDDSRGETPNVVPNEVSPHVLRALHDFPDEPGLLTWVYPFDEYHEWVMQKSERISEVFFGDWFIRAAINEGFPLNSVISTNTLGEMAAGTLRDTTLVSPAPDPGTKWADALVEHVASGGNLLLYGPLDHLDPRISRWLDISLEAPLAGDLLITTSLRQDEIDTARTAQRLRVRPLTSGGGVNTSLPRSASAHCLASVSDGLQTRSFALSSAIKGGGKIAWVRGAFCAEIEDDPIALPKPDDRKEWFLAETLMRLTLQEFGYDILCRKPFASTASPLFTAARKNNGWFFSGHCPSTTARLIWRFPEGVPVPVGADVLITADGYGEISCAKAWHKECRVFVSQAACSEVSCSEQFSGEIGIRRRLRVTGLLNATVSFLPESESRPTFSLDDSYLGQGTSVQPSQDGRTLVAHNISGDLLISW